MKILYVTNMYPVHDYPSFGIHVKEQIESIAKLKNIESDMIFIDGRYKKLNYIKSIFSIKKKLRHDHYDLIHVHYGISGLFLLAFKPKIPVIITLHGGELFSVKSKFNNFLQKYVTMRVLKHAKKVIVLNELTVSIVKRKFKGEIIKLPCGVNTDKFKEIHTSTDEVFIIGFPSSKNRIVKNYPLFKIITDKLKETHNVKIIEFDNMSREEVNLNMNKLDLLLMTSFSEGSPQIVKEAMACNKPIISTLVGDVDDLLKNVENCYTINTFKPEDFLVAIQKILNLSSGDRKSNGRSKLISMGIDENSIANKLYNLYQSVI